MRLGELARRIGAELSGDGGQEIVGVANLRHAGDGELSFLADRRYLEHLRTTRATAVILSPEYRADCPVAALLVENPYAAYARAAQCLHPQPEVVPGIHPTAVVDEGAEVDPTASIGAGAVIEAGSRIGPRTMIGPGCLIGPDCSVGDDCRLAGRVTLVTRVRLGRRVLVHPGAVIGGDGFGFANEDGRWIKIPQLGGVVVGDDCEIGCNTTIDRGALDDTVVAAGVKLDNLIQIAHNVEIGEDTAIAGCTGIAGSARIGRRCAIGGGVGIVGHLEICDDVQLTGTTYVTQSIDRPGTYSSGVPMEPYGAWRRNYTRIKQLDVMARRLRQLERRLAAIEDAQADQERESMNEESRQAGER